MPTTTADELPGHLRAAINRLAFHLRAPATDRGLTPSRLSVLLYLSKFGPQRPGELAATIGIRPASMTRLAEALEDGDWATRTADPDDRRACLLSLTEHGEQALHEWRSEGTTWLSEEIATLEETDREALRRALPVLERLADRHLERSDRRSD